MTFDHEAVRAAFPYVEKRLYLNTASAGIGWRGAGRAPARFFDEIYNRGFDGGEDWRAITGRVRKQIGCLARVEPSNVGFTGSTTQALNLIAHSVRVDPTDRVAVCADEFPSVLAAADILAARGATKIEVPVGDEDNRTEALLEVAAESKYVLVSHIHWETGTKVDLARLSACCSESGAFLIVDGTHALGAVHVDAALADAYSASVFKWLVSGFGLTISITSRRLTETLNPIFRGYANPRPSHKIEYSRHLNYPGLLTLEASLDFMEGLGWEAIYEHDRSLQARLRERLGALDLVTPVDAGAILSIRVPNPSRVAEIMDRRGVSLAARGECLRISPHFYNNYNDIDRSSDIILQVLREI